MNKFIKFIFIFFKIKEIHAGDDFLDDVESSEEENSSDSNDGSGKNNGSGGGDGDNNGNKKNGDDDKKKDSDSLKKDALGKLSSLSLSLPSLGWKAMLLMLAAKLVKKVT